VGFPGVLHQFWPAVIYNTVLDVTVLSLCGGNHTWVAWMSSLLTTDSP